MVLHLVKKDLLLAKRYWIIMLIAALLLPLGISSKIELADSRFLSFFLSTLYIQYLMFNMVSMVEYKYKGSTFLCTTPYTRKSIVRSTYLFVLTIFAGCFALYTMMSLVVPSMLEPLRFSDFSLSLLILTVFFGAIIPVQYQIGYEKTRYAFMLIIVMFPFVIPSIMQEIQSRNIDIRFQFPFPAIVQDILLCALAAAIGWISLTVSTRIYNRKNL